eukprot:sb/3478856/
MSISGDEDYRRRELRDGWRERRATGIISQDTEQDAFVIDTDIDEGSDANIGESHLDSELSVGAQIGSALLDSAIVGSAVGSWVWNFEFDQLICLGTL